MVFFAGEFFFEVEETSIACLVVEPGDFDLLLKMAAFCLRSSSCALFSLEAVAEAAIW